MRATYFVRILNRLAASAVLLTVIGTAMHHTPASAKDPHALIVDVGDYQFLKPIKNVDQDIAGMSAALLRGGLKPQTVQPANSKELIYDVANWVKDTKEKYSLALLYYRGHLLLGADKNPRLAVATTNPAQVANDGTSLLSLLESLSKCDAAVVLLDVECGDIAESSLRQVVKDTMSQLKSNQAVGVVIGCSRPTEPKQDQSGRSAITSFWSQWLRGDTASPPNGILTWQDFVAASQRQLSDRATLVIHSSPKLNSSIAIASVSPRRLDELLSDLADRVANELHRHGIKGTAIPDIQFKTEEGTNTVGQDLGPLLRYCGQKLRSEIAARANFKYQLLNDDWLRSQLQVLKLGPDTLLGAAMVPLHESLSEQVDGEPVAIVLCKLTQKKAHHQVEISCSPWKTKDGTAITTASGSALLNPSEWAMIGKSAVNEMAMAEFSATAPKPALNAALPKQAGEPQKTTKTDAATQKNFKKPYPLLDYGNPDDQDQIRNEIASLEEKARRPHPMKDTAFPFRVSLRRNGCLLGESWSDEDRQLSVKVNKGDVYSVWVENNNTQPVFMRLLVDGLNTLPDLPLLTKNGNFDEVVSKDLAKTPQPAQYASLTNAKAWFCDPGKYEVRGFFMTIDNKVAGPLRDAQRAEFLVTDATDSEAWRQGYPKDVGIVTAAFYKPIDRPESMAAKAGLGTKLGDVKNQKIEVYQGLQIPGELLAVIHLRYGDFTQTTNKPIPLTSFQGNKP